VSHELAELRGAAPGARLITDPDQMESYRRDQTPVVTPGRPRAVLVASSTEDVAAALARAQQHHVPVVARGGGTSLAGGATATDGYLVLSTARMTSIRERASGRACSS
jgi:glycolate oxidase